MRSRHRLAVFLFVVAATSAALHVATTTDSAAAAIFLSIVGCSATLITARDVLVSLDKIPCIDCGRRDRHVRRLEKDLGETRRALLELRQ